VELPPQIRNWLATSRSSPGRHAFEKFQNLQYNDITSSFNITRSGLVLNRSTQTYNSIITLTNTGAPTPASSPIILVVGVTTDGLVNRSGPKTFGPSPYIVLGVNGLGQGETITQLLEFTPSAIPEAVLLAGGVGLAVGLITNPPQDASLVNYISSIDPATYQFCVSPSGSGTCQLAIRSVLDNAYNALWAIRANDASWRAFRSQLHWIAVSGEDDTPHRPVNVPTAPYPQYDITFDVPQAYGLPLHMTTRYVISRDDRYLGATPFLPSILNQPTIQPVGTPAPRWLPFDVPAIPPNDKIVIYIHGGGARAEEADNVASYLHYEGSAQVGQFYTIISFDLPNSAYGEPFDYTQIAYPYVYDPKKLDVLNFEQQYIINFIEALDRQLGNVKNRIVAVIGGSLGGDMGLLLSSRNDSAHPYLNTIVAWSVTSLAPSTTSIFGVSTNNGDEAWGTGGYQTRLTAAGTLSNRHDYFHNLYFEDIADFGKLIGISFAPEYVPPQPVMWYRNSDWQPCKTSSIAQSRFDRYEIYSESMRRWASALDLELVYLSFSDTFGQGAISPYGGDLNFTFPSPLPSSRLLLLAGDKDNYVPANIYYSTQVIGAALTGSLGLVLPGSSASQQAYGKVEFWQNTGHSFHAERPQALAREIVYFINNLDAGNAYLSQGESRSGPPAWTVQGIVPQILLINSLPGLAGVGYSSSLIVAEEQTQCSNCILNGGVWAITGPVAPDSGFADIFGGTACVFPPVINPFSVWQDGGFGECLYFTQ